MVNQANIILEQTLVWCCLADRRWKQCRDCLKNWLELLLMTLVIIARGTVLLDVLLISDS